MNLKQLQIDPRYFRQVLKIDSNEGPKRFADVMDKWQYRDFHKLDAGWKRIAENDSSFNFDTPMRAWLERPRGHSKSLDISVMATWALFASKHKLRGYAAAADRDQARLIRDAIDLLCRLNPWLNQILSVKQHEVTNKRTGSILEIISSDSPSAYGILPSFVIYDEVVHVPNRDLWDSLLSSAAKKQCMFVCITNAGFGESWQWETRELIRQDPNWFFSRLDGPVASWISEDQLDEQRRLLPRISFERLWLNKWTAGVGDALDEEQIQNAIRLKGPISQPKNGWLFFGGLDLGLSRDKAALAIIGKHIGYTEELPQEVKQLSTTQIALKEIHFDDDDGDYKIEKEEEPPETIWHEGTGRLRLCKLYVWTPTKEKKVDIEEIEAKIVELDKMFHLQIGADPWQAAYLIERLKKQNILIQPIDFVPANLKGMCSAVLESFVEGNIAIYPHHQLLADLRGLRVEERNYGVRLTSARGPQGHGDCATALSISLFMAQNKNNARLLFTANRRSDTLIAY